MLAQNVYLFTPVHVSTRLLDVTYLDTENYMIYIAFLQHPDKKKNKKNIDLPTLPIFRPKGQMNLYLLGLVHCYDNKKMHPN